MIIAYLNVFSIQLTRNPKSHGVTQSRKSAALPTNSRLNNHRLMSVSGKKYYCPKIKKTY